MEYSLKEFNKLCEMRGIQYDLVHRVIIDFAHFINDVIWGEMRIEQLEKNLKEAEKNNDKVAVIMIKAEIEHIKEILEFSKDFKYAGGEDTIIKWFDLFKKWYERCYLESDE